MTIPFYEGKYYMFSNFSAFNVNWNGTIWQTAEHAYQAAKFFDITIIEAIKNAPSAHDTKIISKKYSERKKKNWEEIKISIMEEIIRAKYMQHQYIQKILKETENKLIVEDSPLDDFWGW